MPAPRLDAFLDAAAKVLDPADPESFWSCREPFRALLTSGFLAELLQRQLGFCLSGTGELIQAGTGFSGRLALAGGMQLDILLVEPGHAPDELIGYPSHVLIGVVGRTAHARLTLARYRHGASYRNEQFDAETALAREPDELLGAGDVAGVRAGREVFRLVAAAAPCAVILLQSKPFLQYAWQYDPDTGKPRQAICPDSATFRLFYTTRLLKEIQGPGNVAALLHISHHRSHFVRWSALQALFANDRSAALERLEEALDDPHPRVRDAARRALGRAAAQAG